MPSSARFNDSRAGVRQKPEVEQRREEMARRARPSRTCRARSGLPAMVSRICRRQRRKSGLRVPRTNVSSSESGPSRANRRRAAPATMRPDDSTTTREQSFSTMSKRCVLKRIIRPSSASMRSSVRNSRPALTSRPENGSSSTSRSGCGAAPRRAARAAACLSRTPSSTCSGCRAAGTAAAARDTRFWSAARCMSRSRPTSVRYSEAVRCA